MLSASGIPGNDCAPDLAPPVDFPVQMAAVGEEFTVDLFASGWTIADDGGAENVHYQLDPDETPDGVTVDPATGVISWMPTAGQEGNNIELKIIAIDAGTPALADVESVFVNVGNRPVADLNGADPLNDVDAGTFTEGDAPLALAPALTITDTDSANLASATITLENVQDDTFETLAANVGAFDITATPNSTVPGQFTLTLTANSATSLADWQTVLQTVTYQNTSTNPTTGVRNIRFTVNDGALDNQPAAIATVTVAAVNSAPVVDLNGPTATIDFGPAAFTEDGGPVAIVDSGNLSITDVDDTNLESATITLTNIQDAGLEVLDVDDTAVAAAGLAESYDPATGILSLTGSATLADYQAVLRTLTYDNTSQDPETATQRVVTVVVNDGDNDNSPVAMATVDVTAANDPAVADLSGPGDMANDFAATFNESGGPIAVVDPTAVIVDPDSTNVTSVTLTLMNRPNDPLDGEGTESLTGTSSATVDFLYDPATGIATLTDLGGATRVDFETVLHSILYVNSSTNPVAGDRTIKVTVDDGSGNGPESTSTITVVPDVNESPDLINPGDQTFSVGEMISFTLDATDPENDSLIFQVDDSTPLPAGATLDPNTGLFTWTPVAGQTGDFVFNVLVTDQGTPTGVSGSDNEVFTLTINDPAAVDLNGPGDGIDFAASFTEGDAPVNITDPAVTVSDTDDTDVTVTVTISNLSDTGAEILTADTTGTTVVVDDSTSGTLVLTGGSSLAEYATVLATVTYENTSDNPTAGDRLVTVVANDGKIDSATATATVSVTAVNDAPVMALNGSSGEFTDGGPAVPIVDPAATITDADNTNLTSLTITITNRLDGDLEELTVDTTGTSIDDSSFVGGVLTLTGGASLDEYIMVLRTLAYRNTAGTPDMTTRTISLVANDGTDASVPVEIMVTIVAAP